MTAPRERNGAPPQGPATAKITPPTDTIGQQRTATHRQPVVVGEVLMPEGRRTMAAILVRSCGWCWRAHLHRTSTPGAESWSRVGSCGKPYNIIPVRRAAEERHQANLARGRAKLADLEARERRATIRAVPGGAR